MYLFRKQIQPTIIWIRGIYQNPPIMVPVAFVVGVKAHRLGAW